MRLYMLITTVNMWFARVVYERDAWDEASRRLLEFGNIYTMILAGLAAWLFG